MALFPSTPSDAVRAAIAMVAQAREAGAREVQLGVGVHVGEVMMGTIGESERFEATVISDAVNLTARLESMTKQIGCSIIVSGDVYAQLEPDLQQASRRLGIFTVKGKRKPAPLYEVFAADPEALREAKASSRARFDEMLEAYRTARFERALDLAGDLRDAHPEDGPANWWFLRLLREFTEDAPASGGVAHLDEK